MMLPHPCRVDGFDAWVLSDGQILLPSDGTSPLPGLRNIYADADIDALQRETEHPIAATTTAIEQNILLARIDGKLVLFDAGCGPWNVHGSGTGQLLKSLSQIGIAPEQIDIILLSHGHADHCWGVVGLDGRPLFPQAQLFVSKPEFQHYFSIARSQPTSGSLGFDRAMNAYAGRIELFVHGDHPLDTVEAVAAPGHTLGHFCFLLRGAGTRLWVTGDTLFNPFISFRYPHVLSQFDNEAELAAQTRQVLLDRISSERDLLCSYHLPGPGLGKVCNKDGAFKFVPIP